MQGLSSALWPSLLLYYQNEEEEKILYSWEYSLLSIPRVTDYVLQRAAWLYKLPVFSFNIECSEWHPKLFCYNSYNAPWFHAITYFCYTICINQYPQIYAFADHFRSWLSEMGSFIKFVANFPYWTKCIRTLQNVLILYC